jgi:hypothetical protein
MNDIETDLFAATGRPDAQLHPQFLALRDSPLLAPARNMLRDLHVLCHQESRDFQDYFQTSGFDTAMCDIYLLAMFRDAGHTVDASRHSPNFLLRRDGLVAAVEATTALDAGSRRRVLSTRIPHDVSIGSGGALIRKLLQAPWRSPSVADKPLVIAIHDLHRGEASGNKLPMALLHFLFGSRHHDYVDFESHLEIHGSAAQSREIDCMFPAGFFAQPGAENIAAVLLCSDGAMVSKFNRMGQEGAHHSDAVRILRHGRCRPHHRAAGSATCFAYEVGSRGAEHECWNEGTLLVHNPRAIHPLTQNWLGASAEVDLRDGHLVATFLRDFHPFTSVTETLTGTTPGWWVEARKARLARDLLDHSSR